MPCISTELAIGFSEGDIDRPLVVGQLYNGFDRPPFSAGVVSVNAEIRITLRRCCAEQNRGFTIKHYDRLTLYRFLSNTTLPSDALDVPTEKNPKKDKDTEKKRKYTGICCADHLNGK